MEDFTTQVLLALPLALTGVVEEIPQGPVLPLQQLPVQQQGERRLCCQAGTRSKVVRIKVYRRDYLLSGEAADVEQFAQSGHGDERISSGILGPVFVNRWRVTQSTVSGTNTSCPEQGEYVLVY